MQMGLKGLYLVWRGTKPEIGAVCQRMFEPHGSVDPWTLQIQLVLDEFRGVYL